MASAQNIEIEVKFFVADFAPFRDKLLAQGAALIKPRIYERNVTFDTAEESLFQNMQLLRLRRDNIDTLTFKGPAKIDRMSEAKVREELEVQVNDLDIMAAIFQKLGFQPQKIYEKYRETFQMEDIEIVFDELPFGDFIELEGDETKIKPLASSLGLNWEERILHNYLSLMELLKTLYKLPFSDLTFENFAGRAVDFGKIIPQLLRRNNDIL